MSKGVMELHIDLDTATVVQLVNRVTGSKHLFSRKPELELKVPGMGIVELEPLFCNGWRVVEIKDSEVVAECIAQGYRLVKVVRLEKGFAEYEYRVRNADSKPLRSRPRVAIYVACARGGFWGDEGVEGAINTCRYFVDYGYGES